MVDEKLELQEKLRRLTIEIIKHYRGKGPDYVKVKIQDDLITINIKGILSNLSEILVGEGAADIVKDYWNILKPHLEKQFEEEIYEIIGRKFEYTWRIDDFQNSDRTIVVLIKLMNDGLIEKKGI